jgi:hypothetical protein
VWGGQQYFWVVHFDGIMEEFCFGTFTPDSAKIVKNCAF